MTSFDKQTICYPLFHLELTLYENYIFYNLIFLYFIFIQSIQNKMLFFTFNNLLRKLTFLDQTRKYRNYEISGHIFKVLLCFNLF